MSKPGRLSKPAVGEEPAASLHRSGAVARMLRMPVATLRVWERRYALTNTALSPSGQRRYSADDVRRLAFLKQLTDLGHAIGSLASLDLEQLQRVAATHGQALAAVQPRRQASGAAASKTRLWRLVVVGKVLGARLHRQSLIRHLGRPVEILGPFEDVSQAAAALAARIDGLPADAWLLHQPQLHADWLSEFQAAVFGSTQHPKHERAPVPVAVLFSYAADAVCDALAAGGVALLREPQPDAALAQWLRLWAEASATSGPVGSSAPVSDSGAAIAPRRWDDGALADFASRSSTVACECPRHVAELLIQLSRFEVYSAQCEHRSAADAELHAFLGRVAAEARASFEVALEQVALREGLLMPRSPV